MGVMEYMRLKNRIEEVYGVLLERIAILEAQEVIRAEREARPKRKWWKLWA